MNNTLLVEGSNRIAHVGYHARRRNLAHVPGLGHARGKRRPIDVFANNNYLVRQVVRLDHTWQMPTGNGREAREDLDVRDVALDALAHQRSLAQMLRARPAHNLGGAGLAACEHPFHAVRLVLLERSHELHVCGRVHYASPSSRVFSPRRHSSSSV